MHSRPLGMAQSDTEMNILFDMLTSGQFVPPSKPTQLEQRRDFISDCKAEMRKKLLSVDVFCEIDGKLRPMYGLPLATLSFDTSPTGIKGVKAISITIHYATKSFVHESMALKVGAFCGAYLCPYRPCG